MDTSPRLTVELGASFYAPWGGALYARAARLLGDEARAVGVAEELFVRFVVHGRAGSLGERGRWSWVYRVATSHCLRLLDADAVAALLARHRAGAPVVGAAAASTLARMDEATRNIVVLAELDGLPPDEIAEVLGLAAKLVRRRVPGLFSGLGAAEDPASGGAEDQKGGAAATGAGVHPSAFALDADHAAHAAHLASCLPCRAAADESDRRREHFARVLAPASATRVVTAIRRERERQRAGPRWGRIAWMGGALVVIAGLALLVARPRPIDRRAAPFAGVKGASQAKAAGIQIAVRRRDEVRALAPGAALEPGDRLHFWVRADRPRYLELRVRARGVDLRLFPAAGTQAALVQPGQALDRDYLIPEPRNTGTDTSTSRGPSPPPDRLWIGALFADHPFALDGRPGPDVEVVSVPIQLQP